MTRLTHVDQGDNEVAMDTERERRCEEDPEDD